MYLIAITVSMLSFFAGSADARVIYPREIRAGKIANGEAWYDTIRTDKFAVIQTDGMSGSEWWGRVNHFSPGNWRNPLKIGGAQKLYGAINGPDFLSTFKKAAFSAVFVDSCAGAYVFAMEGDTLGWQIGKRVIRLFPELHRRSREVWGRSDFDLDGRDNVFIIIYPFGQGIDYEAFVSPGDMLPLWLPSNGVEAIHVNSRAILSDPRLLQILVHEFQHTIALSWDFYESEWVLEGMATLSEQLVTGIRPYPGYWQGYDPLKIYALILSDWRYDYQHYASADNFFNWLYRVYGLEAALKIMWDPHNGRESVASAVREPWDVVWARYESFIRAGSELASDEKSAPEEQITNTPNPCNPSTIISFPVRASGQAKVAVYNSVGQLVSEMYDGSVQPGLFRIVWDGSNAASGVYFLRVQMNGEVLKHRMMLVK